MKSASFLVDNYTCKEEGNEMVASNKNRKYSTRCIVLKIIFVQNNICFINVLAIFAELAVTLSLRAFKCFLIVDTQIQFCWLYIGLLFMW